MTHASDHLLALFLVYISALIGAEIAQRLKFPGVVGEIAAGCLIGPYAFNLINITEPLEVLAEVGAVLLLFSVGLETSIQELKKTGKTAMCVGTAGVILPFICGGLWAHIQGFPLAKSMFIGAAFVATSAGITSRVLQELGVLDRVESRVILGAAVIDDILAMLLLGAVTSFQAKGTIDFVGLSFVVLQAVGFLALITVVGTRFMKKSSCLLDSPINPLSPLTLSLAGCLGLAVASSYIGLAAIIGAFLAGMIMSESIQRHALEKQTKHIMAFLVPFFFVVTGTKVNLTELKDSSFLLMALVVILLAAFSKVVGCGLGALNLGKKSALTIGVGMMPRGEVGIIVASLGLQAGVFSNTTYSLIIVMSLVTSILAPPLLKLLFSGIELKNPKHQTT